MSNFPGRWVPAVLWTGLLFAASSRPSTPVSLEHGTDKLAHFGAYAVLGLLLAHGWWQSGVPVLVVLLAGVFIGAMEEVYQSFVPGRVPAVGDWIADVLGVTAGLWMGAGWLRYRSGHRASPNADAEDLPHP